MPLSMGKPAQAEAALVFNWDSRIAALERYRQQPSRSLVRKIFKYAEADQALWYLGPQELGGRHKPSSFQCFEAAAQSSDWDKCKAVAFGLLESIDDVKASQVLRFILAARSFLAHDNLALADALLGERRRADEAPEAKVLDRLMFRFACARADPSDEALFSELLNESSPVQPLIIVHWIFHRWRNDGPSPELLKASLDFAQTIEFESDAVRQECLALALCLGDHATVDDLLAKYPSLCSCYQRVLPLARYLEREAPAGYRDRHVPDLAQYAQFHDHLDAVRDSLAQHLAYHTKTVAIVGNAPCEIGTGNGRRIDAHDMVVRFNGCSVADEFVPDYGRKCTVHGRRNRNDPVWNATSRQAKWTVIDKFHTQRQWGHFIRLQRKGARICCLPSDLQRTLRQKLHAPPSLGLMFCVLVKTIRGSLPRESCFGFSLTDQVASDARPAHYFERKSGTIVHNWTQEREMFDQLTSSE